jgi:hypothetical protein
LIERVDMQIGGVDKVLNGGPQQPPGQAFQLMAAQVALADDVEDAEESAESEGRRFWANIRRKLERAAKKLWAMISHLLRVKEWSLTGTVGTGVLGFGEASISVTFC